MQVHADNFASKEFEGKSYSKYPYKDNVVEVDAIIGDIVKELEVKMRQHYTFNTHDSCAVFCLGVDD